MTKTNLTSTPTLPGDSFGAFTRFRRQLSTTLKLAGLTAVIAMSVAAAPVVQYQLTSLGSAGQGQTAYQYDYFLSGLDFLANQELDIRFDPHVYQSLSNAVAPSDFDLLVFQPDVPPGEFGDYSALAKVNHPSLTGTFSVRVVVANSVVPDGQPFFLYDDNLLVNSLLASGTTTALPVVPTVPEPGSLALCFAGLTAGFVFFKRKRRRLAANC